MTALLKFVITSILSLIGFTGPVENEVVRRDLAPHNQERNALVDFNPLNNCDNILNNSCFLLE